MLNKSNMKPLELFVDVEKPPLLERKSSEEGSSILQISSKTEDTKDPKDHAKYDLEKLEKKDSSLNKPKKKFLEDMAEGEPKEMSKEGKDKEKEKKSLSKEDISKFFRKEANIKIEEDSIPAKKKRGRPKKNKDGKEVDKHELPKHKVQVTMPGNSLVPKHKAIKVEGTVKLDLTLYLE